MTSPKRKSNLSMPLAELLEEYIVARPALRPASIVSYRWTLRAFEKHLGRKSTLADLKEETVNAYVTWKLANWSPSSAKRDRISLVVWWRFAARKKLIQQPPIDGIPTVKVPRRNATAWTLSELEKLLGACGNLTGRMRQESDPKVVNRWGVARTTGPELSKWWTSLLLFLYDTGSRIGAALEVTPADIDLDRGLVTLRGDAAKTGLEQVLRISPQTVAAIRELYDPKAKRVWVFCCHPRRLQYYLGRILDLAGLPNDRSRKFHCLRKTCATLTAAAGRLDLAQSTLGHTNGYMTRNYIDQRAAPSQSAADVLPRPVFGNRAAQSVPETVEPATGNDVSQVLARLSKHDLETLVRLAQALGDSNFIRTGQEPEHGERANEVPQ